MEEGREERKEGSGRKGEEKEGRGKGRKQEGE